MVGSVDVLGRWTIWFGWSWWWSIDWSWWHICWCRNDNNLWSLVLACVIVPTLEAFLSGPIWDLTFWTIGAGVIFKDLLLPVTGADDACVVVLTFDALLVLLVWYEALGAVFALAL